MYQEPTVTVAELPCNVIFSGILGSVPLVVCLTPRSRSPNERGNVGYKLANLALRFLIGAKFDELHKQNIQSPITHNTCFHAISYI